MIMVRTLPLLVVALVFVFLASAPLLAADAKTHEGIVVKAGDGKLTMTLKDGTNEHSHNVAKDAVITCGGKTCALEDLKKGYTIKVTMENREGKMVATRIDGMKP
jgi:hypothetical protein